MALLSHTEPLPDVRTIGRTDIGNVLAAHVRNVYGRRASTGAFVFRDAAGKAVDVATVEYTSAPLRGGPDAGGVTHVPPDLAPGNALANERARVAWDRQLAEGGK